MGKKQCAKCYRNLTCIGAFASDGHCDSFLDMDEGLKQDFPWLYGEPEDEEVLGLEKMPGLRWKLWLHINNC